MDEDDTAKYSVSCIIPKSDKKTIAIIEKAIAAAKEAGKEKFGGKIPPNLKTKFRDGDIDRPEDEAYADSMFLNANSKSQPGIVDAKCQKIIDRDEFYSGCYGYASITFYAYKHEKGGKGIGASLNNVMKTKDGKMLGGSRASAEVEFAGIEIGEDDDLLG